MIVIGIFALMDPLRKEIIDSVKKCKTAGINIRMVTGDNIDTAKAIAIEAGIVSKEDADSQYVCMEGESSELCVVVSRDLKIPQTEVLPKRLLAT